MYLLLDVKISKIRYIVQNSVSQAVDYICWKIEHVATPLEVHSHFSALALD